MLQTIGMLEIKLMLAIPFFRCKDVLHSFRAADGSVTSVLRVVEARGQEAVQRGAIGIVAVVNAEQLLQTLEPLWCLLRYGGI